MQLPTASELIQHVAEHYGVTRATAVRLCRMPLHPEDLRDKFAAAIIGGMVADPTVRELRANAATHAKMAYTVADEMIAARLPLAEPTGYEPKPGGLREDHYDDLAG